MVLLCTALNNANDIALPTNPPSFPYLCLPVFLFKTSNWILFIFRAVFRWRQPIWIFLFVYFFNEGYWSYCLVSILLCVLSPPQNIILIYFLFQNLINKFNQNIFKESTNFPYVICFPCLRWVHLQCRPARYWILLQSGTISIGIEYVPYFCYCCVYLVAT